MQANKRNMAKIIHILFAVSIVLVLSMMYVDTDLYYLIANGRYIIKNGIPHINPFTFIPYEGLKAPDIVVQNWLYCVIVAFAHDHFNAFGLFVLQFIFVMGMIGCMYKFIKIRGVKSNLLTAGVILITMLSFFYFNLRPQQLTFILIMIEIIFIEKAKKSGNMKYLFLIVPLIAIEMNIHASYWIMHYIVFLPYLVPARILYKNKPAPDICDGFKKENVPVIAGIWILMFAALFVNPYGWQSIVYVFKSLRSKVFDFVKIIELQSWTISMSSTLNIIMILCLIIFIVCIVKEKFSVSSMFMFLGFTVLMLIKVKWLPFFAVGVIFVVTDMAKYLQTIGNEDMHIDKKTKRLILIAEIIVAILFFILFTVNGITTGTLSTKSTKYLNTANNVISDDEIQIKDYLKIHHAESVYTTWSNGNFYEYNNIKVLTDARPELYTLDYAKTDDCEKTNIGISTAIMYKIKAYTYYRSDKYENFTDLEISASEYADIVDNLNTKYYITDANTTALRLYMDANPDKYRIIYKGKDECLYEKL